MQQLNLAESVSAWRCVGCSDDDVGADGWTLVWPGPWLICHDCASSQLAGAPGPRAIIAQYRGRTGATRRSMRVAYDAILTFKERRAGWSALTAPLAEALSRSVATVTRLYGVDRPVLVPVPSYRNHRPHARRLCAAVPSVDKRLDLLEKTVDFRQSALGRHARRTESSRAYGVRWWHRIKGRVVILADDILTTGETMRACTAVLEQAGAAAVYGAVIMRAVRAPSTAFVVDGLGQVEVQLLETDARGRLPLREETGEVWVRFACGPRCSVVLCAGPLSIPALGTDAATEWSCRCGASHMIRLARGWQEGPRQWLQVSVPPRRASELLVAMRQTADVTVLPISAGVASAPPLRS
jgi:pyrimidine operon attenuation protein/uracil phosphoribosyltransferase